jgi:uncharacterized protein YkwD
MRLAPWVIVAAVATLLPVSACGDELGDAIGFQSTLTVQTLDKELLARAIFAETNRVRRELDLRELKPSAEADEAASIQASMCAARRFLGHENPLAGLATPMERAVRAGLKPSLVAENVAVSPIIDVGDAGQVGVVRTGGRITYIHPETGKPAVNHTYQSFAASVVRRWMESPPHRQNIVNPKLELLGCAAFPSKGSSGVDVFYSVQVFVIKAGLPKSSARDFKKR